MSEKHFDERWYKDCIQEPIREFIFDSKIVELEDDSLEKKAINKLLFPKNTKLIGEKIWQFVFDLRPNKVCKKSHLHNWQDLSWDKWHLVDYKDLLNAVAARKNVDQLSKELQKNKEDTFNWLNSLGDFILEDERNISLFGTNAAIPNKNGVFKEKKHLHINEIKDDTLIEILGILGDDWNEILLHDSIKFGAEIEAFTYPTKKKKDIAAEITEKLKKASNTDSDILAISRLCEWFENNLELGEELFTDLYGRRAELFMNTVSDKESLYNIMRNCTDLENLAEMVKYIEDNPESFRNAQELEKVLEEFSVRNISELIN